MKLWLSRMILSLIVFHQVPAAAHDVYTYHDEYRTYVEAVGECMAEGRHLVDIVDERENSDLLLWMRSETGQKSVDIWIGLSDRERHDFEWVSATKSAFRSWDKFQPSDTGATGEDCVHAKAKSRGETLLWFDEQCHLRKRFVCEDSCPEDSIKHVPGVCGCGVPDIDLDHDGIIDCEEGSPEAPSEKGTAPLPSGRSSGGGKLRRRLDDYHPPPPGGVCGADTCGQFVPGAVCQCYDGCEGAATCCPNLCDACPGLPSCSSSVPEEPAVENKTMCSAPGADWECPPGRGCFCSKMNSNGQTPARVRLRGLKFAMFQPGQCTCVELGG